MEKVKMTAQLYADHQALNKAAFRRSEYDRLTGLINSVNPGLRGKLVAERSKLLQKLYILKFYAFKEVLRAGPTPPTIRWVEG